MAYQVWLKFHLDVGSTGHDRLHVTGALAIDPLDSTIRIRILLDPALNAARRTRFVLVRAGSGDVLSLVVSRDEFALCGTGIFAGLLAELPEVVQIQLVPEREGARAKKDKPRRIRRTCRDIDTDASHSSWFVSAGRGTLGH
jgi:hypothetical protein